MSTVTDTAQRLRIECGLPDIPLASPRSRDRLLAVRDAAVAEFRLHGYLGGSVDEIARGSGVSKPTIYSYFDTKERLFLDAIGDALISAYTGLSPVGGWSSARTAREAVRAFLLDWARRLLSPETIALRRTVIGEAERFPRLASLWALTNATYGDRPLAEALTAMSRAGLLDLPRGDLPLRQLIAMAVGAPQLVATFRPADFDAAELPEIAEGAVAVFWSSYGKEDR